MKCVLILVFFILCSHLTLASDVYRAGILGPCVHSDPTKYVKQIQGAAQSKVDIVVLPSQDVSSTLEAAMCESDNYDESVKILSNAAKQSGIYVVAHLYEQTRCQNGNELIRSNLVFDRQGSIVSVYRKPLNNISNCTTLTKQIGSFSTDFGVTFGLLMEEDLVLKSPENYKGLKNFVITGSWDSDMPILNANHFSSSWAFVNEVNLISGTAIYAGKSGLQTSGSKFVELKKSANYELSIQPPVVTPSELIATDVSQSSVKPLNMKLSVNGYKEMVCHDQLCCQFYLKTRAVGSEIVYGLAAFSGLHSQFSKVHSIGVQSCVLFACDLNQGSCSVGPETNNTKVVFEKITISGNFSEHNTNYPVIVASEHYDLSNQYKFENGVIQTAYVENILHFGIYSRDYAKDSDSFVFTNKIVDSNIYDYIFNENVMEFFDYVWIRLRILIFIVSIYVLEMM